MKRALCLVPMVLLALAGGFTLGVSAIAPPSRSGGTLDSIHNDLLVLRDRLIAQRALRGRYPSMNEGLAHLETFALRVAVTCRGDRDPGSGQIWIRSCGPDERQFQWPLGLKSSCDGTTTRVRSEAELWALAFPAGPSWARDPRTIHAEMGVSEDGRAFLITPAGAQSQWPVPYVYENRHGQAAAAFAFSPATIDTSRRYSVRVDDDIYLYSTVGELYARDVDQRRRGLWVGWLLGLALLGAAYGLFRLARRLGAARVATVALAGAWAVGFGVPVAPRVLVTCYKPVGVFPDNPRSLARQLELLERYHAAGAINDATYRAVLAALEPPTSQPATQPTTPPKR